jgi:uncharacterized protein YhaN
LDFIVNVLKEHEKDLDRLINELANVTEKMGDTGELTGKVEKVEERLTTLQNDIASLITQISTSPREQPAAVPSVTAEVDSEPRVEEVQVRERGVHGPPVILRCKEWDDFQNVAAQAQTLSFMYREAERIFQVDAVKDNQIITYSGPLPKGAAMLKAWLSKRLDVTEKKIFEGILAIG